MARSSFRKWVSLFLGEMLLIGLFISLPFNLMEQVRGSPGTWWNEQWPYRKAIIVDNSKVSGADTDFPILLDVYDFELASKAQQDGHDIAFCDSEGVKLAHEIEFYDNGTGHLVAWVKVPSLSPIKATVIYMYYGSNTTVNQEDPAGVWDSGFVLVQHLEESGGTRYDSTINGNDGIVYGGVAKSSNGKIDGADEFDGVNDYAEVANSPSLNPTSAITVELWMNLSSTGNYINLVNKGTYGQYYLRSGPTEGSIYWYVKFADGTSICKEGNIGWTWNTWNHIVATVNVTTRTIQIYLNGVVKLSNTFGSGKSIIATTNPVRISDVSQRWIKGSVDEARISNVARSADWILTCYNNQKNPNSFYTMGNEQATGTFFYDSFDDNSTDLTVWKTLEKNDGTVSETGGRLECSTPTPPFNVSSTAGYITRTSYDLSNRDMQIEASNQHLCEACLAITLDGINDHFWYSNNFYVIEKHRWSETCKVKKRIDGGERIYLYDEKWTGPTGFLRISIYEGIIYFYEEENLRYFEPFNLSSYNCYIHFEANTWNQSYYGTDYFDNFKLLNNKPNANNLKINPTEPQTTDDLIGSYTYHDADADIENGTEIRWYMNGTLQPQLNDTLIVPSDQTSIGEEWYFTVRAKDGLDFGDLQTSPTVTIQ